MKLIEIIRTDKWITSGGKSTSAPIGMFECPACKCTVEKVKQAGLKARSCGSPKCRKSTFQPNPHNTGRLKRDAVTREPYYSVLKEKYRILKQVHTYDSSIDTFAKFYAVVIAPYTTIRLSACKVRLLVKGGIASASTISVEAVSDLVKYKKTGGVGSKFLYLIQVGEFTKIGVTNDVQNRVSAISTCNPFEVKLLSAIEVDSAYQVEKFLHFKFRDVNIKGEWFKLVPDDIAYIGEYLSSL